MSVPFWIKSLNLLLLIFTRKKMIIQEGVKTTETKELTNHSRASISISLVELHHHIDNHLVSEYFHDVAVVVVEDNYLRLLKHPYNCRPNLRKPTECTKEKSQNKKGSKEHERRGKWRAKKE
jgi:hypothetical protein